MVEQAFTVPCGLFSTRIKEVKVILLNLFVLS